MLQAVRLFYDEDNGLSRQEIAKRLNKDAREISWLLEKAREDGIVRIDILIPAEAELKRKFQERYPHVLDVVILETRPVKTPDQYNDLLRKFAAAAADYYTGLLDGYLEARPVHVGLSGGETISEIAAALSPRTRKNLYFHALSMIGYARFSKGVHHVLPSINAHFFWLKAGRVGPTKGQSHIEFATVAPYDSTKPGPEARAQVEAELDRLAAKKNIREVIEAMDSLDIVFPGLGLVNPPEDKPAFCNRLGMTGILQNVVTPEQLVAEGAVGEMCGMMFDAQGRSKDKWRFFLSAGHYSEHPGLEFFRHMAAQPDKRVIVIAGTFKENALRAALRGKLFNALITDSITAQKLIKGRS
jgi:deoxyribonucleoside regulator